MLFDHTHRLDCGDETLSVFEALEPASFRVAVVNQNVERRRLALGVDDAILSLGGRINLLG